MTSTTARRAVAVAAGLSLLVVLAIANAAGYRFGVADQAFYLPSILHAIDPTLYPSDAALLQAQGGLMVSDELTAFVLSHAPLSIETLFLWGHIASLALLMVAAWAIGTRLGLHSWTAAAAAPQANARPLGW